MGSGAMNEIMNANLANLVEEFVCIWWTASSKGLAGPCGIHQGMRTSMSITWGPKELVVVSHLLIVSPDVGTHLSPKFSRVGAE
jgi:hypothetical protein